MSTVDLLRADALQPLLTQIGTAAQAADTRAGNAATSASQAATHAGAAQGHRAAAETAAQQAAQSALAAQGGAGSGTGGASGADVRSALVHARIEGGLSSPDDVWPVVPFAAPATTGVAQVLVSGDGYFVVFPQAGAGTAVFEIDLGPTAQPNPILTSAAVAVHARALAAPEDLPASMLVEPLDSAGRPIRSVQAHRAAFRGHGVQAFAAEGVSLFEAGDVASLDGSPVAPRRAARLRITFAATRAVGATVGGVFFQLSGSPYLRALPPELAQMAAGKADKLASRMTNLAAGAAVPPVLASESQGEFFVVGAGTTTLPSQAPEGAVLYVWHDASSGTVTLAAPSGMTLRGTAAMSARGQVRRCVRRGTVWYVH